jgi:hypothetical protein
MPQLRMVNGAFLQGGYFSLTFDQAARIFPNTPDHSAPIHIHELFIVLILCRLFPNSLSGRHIRLFIDNTIIVADSVVAAVNKGTAKGLTGPQTMVFLREIYGFRPLIIFVLPANTLHRNLTFSPTPSLVATV